MRLALIVATTWVLAAAGAVSGEAAPRFTAKPTAARVGDKVKISFAVSAPTDLVVYVENAMGEPVRHSRRLRMT